MDHVRITAIYGAWTSAQKTSIQILASNRGGLTHYNSQFGATPSNSYARIKAYRNADGSVSFYVFFAAGSYSVCNYSIELAESGVVIEDTPTNVGATPSGTAQYTW